MLYPLSYEGCDLRKLWGGCSNTRTAVPANLGCPPQVEDDP